MLSIPSAVVYRKTFKLRKSRGSCGLLNTDLKVFLNGALVNYTTHLKRMSLFLQLLSRKQNLKASQFFFSEYFFMCFH